MWANMMGGLSWGGMGVGMIFFWIIVVVLVLLVAKALILGDSSGKRSERSAIDVLSERYAAGEIDHDEYERKRRDLND